MTKLLEKILTNENYASMAFFFGGIHTYSTLEAIKDLDIEKAGFHGLCSLIVMYSGRYFIKRIKKENK